MTRLERMTCEALHWAPRWGAAWALGYIAAAFFADGLERRRLVAGARAARP